MRTTMLALSIVILATIFLIEPLLQVQTVEAIWPYSYIYFFSPRPSDELVYQNTSLPLIIAVRPPSGSPEITKIVYSLDEGANVTLLSFSVTNGDYNASGTLTNLAEGNHIIRVQALDVTGEVVISESEVFTVDTTYRYPAITMISPINQTYNKNMVDLTFTIDAKVMNAYYSLDGLSDKSFIGNITLTALAEGSRRITVTVHYKSPKYFQEKYVSRTVYFEINSSKNGNSSEVDSKENAIMALVVVAVTIAAVASIAVILYRRMNEVK